MKRFLLLVLTLSLIFPSACGLKKKSTVERVKDQVDRVKTSRSQDKRRPGKPYKTAKKGSTLEVTGKQRSRTSPFKDSDIEAREVIKPERLKQIPKQLIEKEVIVSGSQVPLRRGPGSQFLKVGIASKGDTFKLLRIQQWRDGRPAWYFAQDDKNKKFFISSLFSSITEAGKKEKLQKEKPQRKEEQKKDEPIKKEIIQTRTQIYSENFRSEADPTPPLPNQLKKAKHITLNFEGTEVYDVITTFCELLQIDYLIEGEIRGKVTLQTFNKIPVQDLYSVLEQILALHNITVVRSGKFYRFLPIKDAPQKPLGVYYGNDRLIPSKERMIIQIIPLNYISVEAMKKIITPLATKNAKFIDIPGTKNMMMIEMASNIKRIIKLVEALDIDKLASSDIQLYQLKNAEALTVVDELNEIYSSMGYTDALGKSLTFLPLERLNSILIVNAFERVLPTIEFWITKLDQPVSEGEVSTFVYYVQNGDSVTIANLLNEIFPDQQGTTSSQSPAKLKKASSTYQTPSGQTITPGEKKVETSKKKEPKITVEGGIQDALEGEITIVSDKDTNSIIIRTSPRNYPAILEIINKLDIFPQQVLIEVLIIDLTIDQETRSGLDWAFQAKSGSTTFSQGVNAETLATTLGSKIGTATANFLPGGSFLIEEPGRLIAQLEAFAADSKADVLANPILVTTDNKAASISVTDEVPIESSTITTPTAGQPLTQSTIEFRSVGIKLDILPKINSDNFVNLKINQEISNVGPTVTLSSGGTTPSFSTRLVNTEVVLKNHQILVMGGLMRTDIIESNTGVPLLRKIPWLGKLFGKDIEEIKKTELMIFITPHIISNSKDSARVTKQFQKRLGNLKKSIKES